MKESISPHHNERDSNDLGAQLTALSEQSAQLVTSYGDVITDFIRLLRAKIKANAAMLLSIFTLVIAATVLTSLVWVSLHVLFAYALVSLGLSWFFAAGLVMTINIVLVYYLLITAIRLFDKASSDLLDDFLSIKK
ncbi:hypothetical protein PSECIP111951_02923 [Pseudoalteromonas holothuriae]|uniref:Uncharacterized protein n=1 Tax=Pseudoalteromonas holothuriae TaxID=2963714 RepID=A0A9W4R3D2_9GAMM|nr:MULTISPECIES: hypothetical protein [unclassified Pseudoalteromonas]CAH9063543.1 hypothetical protein PSECIP111951_02923 [Pseudoalteromonas sp. CIP111951]CAH9064694.1 hypothetical protein PSECIP111854_03512 [Pseudoalteromonas sp. CIP111854]